jgi:hypothetical protein
LIDDTIATDATNVFKVTLSKERMTVDGKWFGHATRCYIPIFYNGNEVETNNLYMGSHTMYEEYVIYDNTLVSKGADYA